MANLNRVFLIGNLTRDPEVRYIPSGKAVADLNLAINRRYKTSSGEDREDTCFIGVVAWGRQAETAGEYLTKGSCIFVEGSVRYDQWESNGEKRSRLRVTADRIQFMDRPKRTEFADAPEGTQQSQNQSAAPPSEDAANKPDESKPEVSEKTDSDNLPF